MSLSAFLCGQRLGAQQIAVHMNALDYVLMTPDVGLDFVTGEKTTVGLNISGHWRPYGFTSKLISVQPQFRYWFSGRPLNREYVGVSALFWYVMSLGKRWGLEFSGGLSLMFFNQKRYSSSDSYGDYYEGGQDWANSKGCTLIPSNLGVTFIYIIK